MTRDEIALAGENSRRMFLRNGLLVGAGAAAVGITSISLTGTAQAASVSALRARMLAPRAPVPARRARLAEPASSAPIQWAWAWCSKCQGLWYSKAGGDVCPAGGHHGGAKSYNYGVYYDGEGTDYQEGWSYCVYCSGLFYSNGQEEAGACPYFQGYSGHQVISSYAYIVFYSSGSYTDAQPGWRWCSQCQGMWYGNKNSRGGVCPLNDSVFSHNGTVSYPYQMID
jgi:hypothetical protein